MADFPGEIKELPFDIPYRPIYKVIPADLERKNPQRLEEIADPNVVLSVAILNETEFHPMQEMQFHLYQLDRNERYEIRVNQEMANFVMDYLVAQFRRVISREIIKKTPPFSTFGEIKTVVLDKKDNSELAEIINPQHSAILNNKFTMTPLNKEVNLGHFYRTIGAYW